MKMILSFLCVLGSVQMAVAGEVKTRSQGVGSEHEFVAETSAAAPVPTDPDSYFGKTLAWYDEGTDVKWDEVRGHWVGRCFAFDAQKKPVNAFLSYLEANGGPGFPSGPAYMDSFYHTGRDQDYYDNFTDYSEEIRDTKRLLRAGVDKGQFQPVTEEPTVTATLDLEPNKRIDFKTEYRMHSGKLVSRMTNLIAQSLYVGHMKKRTQVAAGQVIFSCYYFKKVGN